MSNPPHTPVPPSNRFSKDSLSGDITSDDIPAARRQSADVPLHEIERATAQAGQKSRSQLLPSAFILGFLLLAGAAVTGLWQWNRMSPNAPLLVKLKQTWTKAAIAVGVDDSQLSNTASSEPPLTEEPSNQSADSPNSVQPPPTEPPANADTLLNHRRYEEAPQEDLVALNPNSRLKLQPEAQKAVNAMLAKAKAEGVQLGIISAFRTVEDQSYLYFDIKAERGQSAKTRAEVSAPPGYSEHHTGYAVDFIDTSQPDTQLKPSFENTPAYKWLHKNAAFFNFELSFPKDGASGVSYEPWHWRYVGDQKSLELFYKE